MVLTAVDENTPVAVEVLPGQVHEATQVEKMLDPTRANLFQIDEAIADKGFDGQPQRQAMLWVRLRLRVVIRVWRWASATSFEKSEHSAGDSLSSQSAKTGATESASVRGMQQDRTADWHIESWAVLSLIAVVLGRNKIERLIGKLKEYRRIATRYDKLKETFLGIIQLALAYICLKANLIVNRA
jgi:hypothetical protein